jgi:uncharacterized LabA/DUF88 family protein
MNNYAFIDSQNLNLGVKNDLINPYTKKLEYKGWRLHFGKFRVYIRDKYDVKQAFLFIGKVDGNEWLYSELQNYGYKIVFKPTTKIFDKYNNKWEIKGNVDAELVLHAMLEFKNYEKAVIVAGDSDYRCLIEYLLDQTKLKRLLIPNIYRTPDLFKPFDKYIDYVSPLENKLKK